MKRIVITRPVFTIQPGMTDAEVIGRIGSHVVRQPATVTWCERCERFVDVNHACALEVAA